MRLHRTRTAPLTPHPHLRQGPGVFILCNYTLDSFWELSAWRLRLVYTIPSVEIPPSTLDPLSGVWLSVNPISETPGWLICFIERKDGWCGQFLLFCWCFSIIDVKGKWTQLRLELSLQNSGSVTLFTTISVGITYFENCYRWNLCEESILEPI